MHPHSEMRQRAVPDCMFLRSGFAVVMVITASREWWFQFVLIDLFLARAAIRGWKVDVAS